MMNEEHERSNSDLGTENAPEHTLATTAPEENTGPAADAPPAETVVEVPHPEAQRPLPVNKTNASEPLKIVRMAALLMPLCFFAAILVRPLWMAITHPSLTISKHNSYVYWLVILPGSLFGIEAVFTICGSVFYHTAVKHSPDTPQRNQASRMGSFLRLTIAIACTLVGLFALPALQTAMLRHLPIRIAAPLLTIEYILGWAHVAVLFVGIMSLWLVESLTPLITRYKSNLGLDNDVLIAYLVMCGAIWLILGLVLFTVCDTIPYVKHVFAPIAVVA
ncbi:hypothetical protein NEDG_00057 [Nematocida displodere]|uniref:Uncharacterized protein n=1 Tax=Nematocida displodere TaxID=1805483 RepID=A0A177EKD2_9MICR|nr:hypothetical protein NEDG_00057 [Nematocida displodere]